MNTSQQIDVFYDFSVFLTGYGLVSLYGTGQGELYFESLKEILGDDFVTDLLTLYQQQVIDSQPGGIGDLNNLVQMNMLNTDQWGPVCRNIIKMWYMGNWYQLPTVWRQTYVNSDSDTTRVLSKNAYIEGLVWKAMGRHPKSAKQPGYGTWSFAPELF